jgi:hypothetical protein
MGDIIRQPGARDRLRRLEDFAHLRRRLLGRFHGQSQRLAEDAGGDRAR